MKNIILNEISKNGIFLNNELLNESEKKTLKKEFYVKKIIEIFNITNEDEIKKISETLFNFYKETISKIFCVNILMVKLNVQQYFFQERNQS